MFYFVELMRITWLLEADKLISLFCLFAASYPSPVERKPSFSPSAIVIGSGFAGLAAARALQNASFKVDSQMNTR